MAIFNIALIFLGNYSLEFSLFVWKKCPYSEGRFCFCQSCFVSLLHHKNVA